jgi:hypothetical protein
MTDSHDQPGSKGEPGHATANVPRWVKVLGFLAIVVVLLVLGLHLTGTVPAGHMP